MDDGMKCENHDDWTPALPLVPITLAFVYLLGIQLTLFISVGVWMLIRYHEVRAP